VDTQENNLKFFDFTRMWLVNLQLICSNKDWYGWVSILF